VHFSGGQLRGDGGWRAPRALLRLVRCRAFRAALLGPLLLAGAAGAQPAGPGPLSGPAPGDPLTIVMDHLRARRAALGLAPDDLDEVRVRDRYVTRSTGVTQLYLGQQLGGIDVFGTDTSVSVDRDGRILALGLRFVPGLRGRPGSRRAILSAAEAVEAAAVSVGFAPASPPERRAGPRGRSRAQLFEPGDMSRDPIPVQLEYVAREVDLRLAWNVVLRTPEGRHWWNLHVDAETGELLRGDDWIDRDSYRVFALPLVSPDEGPRSLVSDVADPVASPFGWHDTNGFPGAEFTDTRGNNVSVQADPDGDDSGSYRPDGGAGLAFDFPLGQPLDLTLQPSGNRDAALANLFYLTNVVHDVMYAHGFDEVAGNFQVNNYGRGGLAGDPVQADAQDGADVDNAQFATPPDGSDPRLEMFLWEQSPAPRLDVASPPSVAGSYPAGKALFGGGTPGLAGGVVQALDPADASGPTTTDACSPLSNAGAVAGHIALVDRGTCLFVDKVGHAQDAGAIGVIVVNNQGDALVNMAGADPSLVIPAVFLGQSDGAAIRAALGSGVSATLVSPADRDSALDNGVGVHEYGHGVTNRLTGGPSNVSCLDAPESAGMGEGWSDWFALVFTAKAADAPEDARAMATYLVGEPPSGGGIRNYPYSTDLGISPLDYGDISSLNEPHGVGEVWAGALWEMYWNLVFVYGFDPDLAGGSAGNELALELVLDALKMQPCDPTFVEGRDALLNADLAAQGGANACLIWAAFAKRGVGESASDGGGPNNLNVSAAFDVPAGCEPQCGDGTLQVGEQCDDGNTESGDGCEADCSLPLPEPDATLLLAAGLAFLGLVGRRRIRA
jgi:extracellular elastinolytic metalloproteinase